MKTKLLSIVLLLLVSFVHAQEDVCAEKEKQFREYLSNKDYSNANLSWLDVREKCAKYNENIYILGNEVLNYNIEVAPDEKKEEAVRELLKMYKKYDAVFPQNTNANDVKSAMALYTNKVGSTDEVYTFLDNAYKKQPETFRDPEAIYLYFKLYFTKFQDGKSNISQDDVLEKYNKVNGLVFENLNKYPQNTAEYERVNMASKALINDLLICENLTPFFEKNYEKNKDNSAWLTASATTLSDKCKTSKMFETIGLQLDQISPSSQSAFFLGEYYLNARQQEKAIEYFEKSVKLASGIDKGKKAYTVASILSTSNKAKANQMIDIAMRNDPTTGKYYIFQANLYVNSISECATTPELQSAIFQLAANIVVKAGVVERKLKKTADKAASEYLKRTDKKLKGKSVKINCWINETVQF